MMFLAVGNFALGCKGQDKKEIENKIEVRAVTNTTIAKHLVIPSDWVEIRPEDSFLIAMPYADTGNFTHKKIYDCARCLLRPEVSNALILAGHNAATRGFKIVIYDCYRPMPYQEKMYHVVPDKRYVADPKKGSMHNRGCAVDVGLADTLNNLLDMGTDFDDFSEKAAYSSPGLSSKQQGNRTLLRAIMTSAGFKPYEQEWWHFNYKKNDYPLSDYIWPCN